MYVGGVYISFHRVEKVSCSREGLLVARKLFRAVGYNTGTLLGTPNREPQEYSRYIIGIYLPGTLYSYYIPTIFLGFPVWASE